MIQVDDLVERLGRQVLQTHFIIFQKSQHPDQTEFHPNGFFPQVPDQSGFALFEIFANYMQLNP